jgi:hypothetical protein
LFNAIKINECEVEVYDEKKMGSKYPRPGEKLNRPALITFFNVKKQVNLKMNNFCDKLRKIA